MRCTLKVDGETAIYTGAIAGAGPDPAKFSGDENVEKAKPGVAEHINNPYPARILQSNAPRFPKDREVYGMT